MGGPVALVDCNNFYWRCEALFQPKLWGQPGVVLSNNDGFCNRAFHVKGRSGAHPLMPYGCL